MAKLKARGRQEIARLIKTEAMPDDKLASEVQSQVALMSDGNILSRRVIRWRPGSSNLNYGGKPTHDYGWKVKGKIRAGLTPEDFVRINQDKGFALESASSQFLTVRGDTIENVANEPIRSEAKAATEKRAKVSRAAKPTPAKKKPYQHGYRTDISGEAKGDGPGLYVTNAYTEGTFSTGPKQRSVVYGPFRNMELAEIAAWDRLSYIEDMKFSHLSPVEIVEANSLDHAEEGFGHSWWRNGLRKGPPSDPRQTSLF
jgi:hypothetical protein